MLATCALPNQPQLQTYKNFEVVRASDGWCNDIAINAAIRRVHDQGGGTVYLFPVPYKTSGAISLLSYVELVGMPRLNLMNASYKVDGAANLLTGVTLVGGGATIIKNCNDYGIECVGGSGTEINGASLRGITVTRDASDTNDKYLIYLYFADRFDLQNVYAYDAYSSAVYINYCDNLSVDTLRIEGFGNRAAGNFDAGFTAINGSTGTIRDVQVDNKSVSKSSSLYGVVINSQYLISDIDVQNLVTSDTFCQAFRILANNIVGSNLAARNCSTSNGSGFAYGFFLDQISHGRYSGMVAANIDNTTTAAQSYGIFINGSIATAANDNVLHAVMVTGGSGTGIEIDTNCDRNVLTGRSTDNGTNFTDNGTNTNAAAFDST